FLFFCLSRLPPIPSFPLFPYTTLFRSTVSKHGAIESCRFWPGYFEDTLLIFQEQVAVAFCDVDLVESLKTCIKHLWPLMADGARSEEHTSELQSRFDLVCRLLLEKKKQ